MNVQNFTIGNAAQNPTGMQLLASTVLAGAGKTLDVSGIPYRNNYLIVIIIAGKAGSESAHMSFNGDNAAGHYDYRTSSNGGADSTAVSQNDIIIEPVAANTRALMVAQLCNLSTNPLGFLMGVLSGGSAGTAPNRAEIAGRGGVTMPVTQITVTTSANNMNAGTAIYVYGSN